MTKANDQLNELKTESILKKYLTAEVKWLIAVVGFIVGVVAPYYQIRQDIELIKQNHFYHIENIQKEILDIKKEQVRNEETMIQLMEKISELKYSK